MKILVTGSAGHLGEALMRTLAGSEHNAVGCDVRASPYTRHVGSVADRAFAARCMDGVDAVLHTATLHKPHVGTHTRQAFVDTNVSGTLTVLEAALANRVSSVIFTSTTSGSTHVGGSIPNGSCQPPRKTVVTTPETTSTFRYSAK